MKQKQHGAILLLFVALLFTGRTTMSLAQVTFKATAPATVVEGEQFRLSYVLNKEGRDIRLPDMSDFDLLFGPSTSTSYSQRTINGKTTSESSVTYTYILVDEKTGFLHHPGSFHYSRRQQLPVEHAPDQCASAR